MLSSYTSMKNQSAQKSTQEKHFLEITDIIKGKNSTKCSYRAAHDMKTQFIKEEIKRCTDQNTYVPEIMKLAEDRMKVVNNERKSHR